MRTTLVPLLAILAVLGIEGALASGTPLKDAKEKVPAEADRVLTGVAAAFRSGDAEGVCARMPGGKDARLHLNLKDLSSGAYTREQATEILKTQYFAKRRIVSMKPTDECAGCGEWRISRGYAMTCRIGEKEYEASLVITLERKKVAEDAEYAWYLTALREG